MTRGRAGDALYQAGDDVLVAGVDPVGVVDVGEARAAVGRGVGVGDMGDRAGVEVDDEGRGGEGAVQKYVVAGEDAARRHRGGWEMGEREATGAVRTEAVDGCGEIAPRAPRLIDTLSRRCSLSISATATRVMDGETPAHRAL